MANPDTEQEVAALKVFTPAAPEAPVLVCGLGSLGQACLQRLLSFNVPLACVDLEPPQWRDPSLEQRLRGCLTLGDMRLPHVLRRARPHTQG